MTRFIFLFLFSIAILFSVSCNTDTEKDDPTFHIFLLLGQSNMAGYPEPTDEDMVPNERVQVLGYDTCNATDRIKDEWAVAVPPLHSCSQNGLGPGDWFGKTLIQYLPEDDTIGLVPNAINGQAIGDFLKGTSRYDRIIERAQIAIESGGVIRGILFHQGESNPGSTMWPNLVEQLVADIKADLEIKRDIPFLAGEMLYSGSAVVHNEQIAKLPDLIPNAYVISADGLEVDPTDTEWGLHFGRDAQVEFGKRYAETMKTAMGL